MSSPRVEELPDDFDEKIDLNQQAPPQAASTAGAQDVPSLESMMNAAGTLFPPKKDPNSKNGDQPTQPGAAMPPVMDQVRQHTADDILKMMNKMPLFMTTLDETDETGGENMALEAIKALAYEGTRAENAANFRENGNEQAKLRRWADAREFYDKALAALKLPQKPQDPEEGEPDMDVELELDPVEEERKEREIEEASLANRALCNLELSNCCPSPPHYLQDQSLDRLTVYKTDILHCRKLRIMQPRLRSDPSSEPLQRKSLVPLLIRLSLPRQTRRSRRRMHPRPSSRPREQSPPTPLHQDRQTQNLRSKSGDGATGARRAQEEGGGHVDPRAEIPEYSHEIDEQGAGDGGCGGQTC